MTVKDKEEKKEQDSRPATEAQIRLAEQLEQETNYQSAVPSDVLRGQSRTAVSEYIHELKERKIRDQALRAANARRLDLGLKHSGFSVTEFPPCFFYSLCSNLHLAHLNTTLCAVLTLQ